LPRIRDRFYRKVTSVQTRMLTIKMLGE